MNAATAPDAAAPVGYRLFGGGPHKVLVLHGWFGDEGFLEPLLPALDAARFTYACMAYRGYGASRHLSGAYSIEEISRDAIGLADRLGWDEFSVAGHSMGAKVAQRIYLDAPARVRRIVGITPVGAGAVPFDSAGRALFEGAQTDAGQRSAILDYATGNRLARAWVQSMTQRSLQNSRPEAFGAYFRAWADTDFASRLAGARLAVRLVVGRYDPSITADVAHASFAPLFTDCAVEVIENAGHYPADETPIFLVTTLERLLSS